MFLRRVSRSLRVSRHLHTSRTVFANDAAKEPGLPGAVQDTQTEASTKLPADVGFKIGSASDDQAEADEDLQAIVPLTSRYVFEGRRISEELGLVVGTSVRYARSPLEACY